MTRERGYLIALFVLILIAAATIILILMKASVSPNSQGYSASAIENGYKGKPPRATHNDTGNTGDSVGPSKGNSRAENASGSQETGERKPGAGEPLETAETVEDGADAGKTAEDAGKDDSASPENGDRPPFDNSKTAVFMGVVRDAGTGAGISAVSIDVYVYGGADAGNITTVTIANGAYFVRVPGEQTVSLEFTHRNYENYESQRWKVESGRIYEHNRVLHAIPVCEIAGTAIDTKTGKPVKDFRPALKSRFARGYFTREKNDWASGDGRFAFRVRPGTYEVTTDNKEHEYSTSEILSLPGLAWSNGWTLWETKLFIDNGITADARIEGYVTDAETGFPIEGVEVNCRRDAPGGTGSLCIAHTDAAGYYELRVPAELEVELFFRKGRYFYRTGPGSVGKEAFKKVNVELEKNPKISFRISGDIKCVRTQEPLKGIPVALVNPGGYIWHPEWVSDSSGRYDIECTIDARNLLAGTISPSML